MFVMVIHDPLSSKISSNWPDNVSVFSNKVETYEAITKSGETIYIHGFSYENRASYENKIDEYPSRIKAKRTYILVSCMVRTVNLQLTKDIPSSF